MSKRCTYVKAMHICQSDADISSADKVMRMCQSDAHTSKQTTHLGYARNTTPPLQQAMPQRCRSFGETFASGKNEDGGEVSEIAETTRAFRLDNTVMWSWVLWIFSVVVIDYVLSTLKLIVIGVLLSQCVIIVFPLDLILQLAVMTSRVQDIFNNPGVPLRCFDWLRWRILLSR